MKRQVEIAPGHVISDGLARELDNILYREFYGDSIAEDPTMYSNNVANEAQTQYQDKDTGEDAAKYIQFFQEVLLKEKARRKNRMQQTYWHPRTRDLNSMDPFSQKKINARYIHTSQAKKEKYVDNDSIDFSERNPQTLTELLENSSPLDAKDTLAAVSLSDQRVRRYNPSSFSTRLYLEPDLELLRN